MSVFMCLYACVYNKCISSWIMFQYTNYRKSVATPTYIYFLFAIIELI